MNSMAERIQEVRRRIRDAAKRSGRAGAQLVAVSKTVPAAVLEEALGLGVSAFGENRLQEALPKIQRIPAAEWHFIGRLQTNKVKDVVGRFSLIQSLDRWKLAEALHHQCRSSNTDARVLVQVNIGGELQKGGVSPPELHEFLRELTALPRIRVEGLMAVPPYTDDPEEVRPYFREMCRLFNGVHLPGIQMNILSMGMSNDFEVAVEEGATLVRVGSAIFGERNCWEGAK